MYATLRITSLSVLEAVLCLGSCASAQTAQLQSHPSAALDSPVISSRANLEHLPPSAPIVMYENGVLTISAYNSTLSDVLREISDQTGADIDNPSSAEERVVASLGPAPARDVLRSLLAGSQFDYVIVGLVADPNALVRVLLFARPPGTEKLPAEDTRQTSVYTSGAQPRADSDEISGGVQLQGNSQEPVLPVRAQQQMLQQRNQMVMEAFRQDQQTH